MRAAVPFGVWRSGEKLAAFADINDARRYASRESRKWKYEFGIWANGKALAVYREGIEFHPKTGRIIVNVSEREAVKC